MAQSTTYINGTGTKVFIDDVAIGYLKDNSSDVSGNMIETSNKDSGKWSEFLPGRNSGTISGSALMRHDATEGYTQLFADITAGTLVAVRISNENPGDNELVCNCYVSSLSNSAPDDDVSSYDFGLQVTGAVAYPLIT